MEFLIVRYPEPRPVIIDDAEQGQTNRVIELAGGQHTVTLGGSKNFSPTEQTVSLRNTSVVSPHEIRFT